MSPVIAVMGVSKDPWSWLPVAPSPDAGKGPAMSRMVGRGSASGKASLARGRGPGRGCSGPAGWVPSSLPLEAPSSQDPGWVSGSGGLLEELFQAQQAWQSALRTFLGCHSCPSRDFLDRVNMVSLPLPEIFLLAPGRRRSRFKAPRPAKSWAPCPAP